jgi:hypothetical protein
MSYNGSFKITKPEKYMGDYTKVVYRSLWERQCFKWCENNPNVKAWNSEEVVVPYLSRADKRMHRYFVDLLVEMTSGEIFLIEIKPKIQTKPPVKPKRKTKKYINEVVTYVKNQDKWESADKFANHKGWKFQIWTEDTLKNLGIKLLKSAL